MVRQTFIHEGIYLSYAEMDRRMQPHEAYQALPAKVAQWVLRTLDKNWQSFFAARAAWKADPSQYLGCPRLPGYKDKQRGRTLMVYTVQALSAPALRQGVIRPSQLDITVQTQQSPQSIQQVRLVPRGGFYVMEVVYEREPARAINLNPAWYAGIDIGLNTLTALASNKPGFIPRIVNGRPVKSVNPFYNKRRAGLQRQLGEDTFTEHGRESPWLQPGDESPATLHNHS